MAKIKRQKPKRSAKAWVRTAANKKKAREKHANNHPNDVQARDTWKEKPIKTAAAKSKE